MPAGQRQYSIVSFDATLVQFRLLRSGLPSSFPGLQASITSPSASDATDEHDPVSPAAWRTRPSLIATIKAKIRQAVTTMGFSMVRPSSEAAADGLLPNGYRPRRRRALPRRKPRVPGVGRGAALRRAEEMLERHVEEGAARLGEDGVAVGQLRVDVEPAAPLGR